MRLLTFIFIVVLCGCSTTIEHELLEKDANEVATALEAHGIRAIKTLENAKKGSFSIAVPSDKAAEAMNLLLSLKLPRPKRQTTKDIASTSGILDGPEQIRLRQAEALEGDVEETLEAIEGVTLANVEIVLPTQTRVGEPKSEAKASVLLKVNPTSVEAVRAQADDIRQLVSGSVEALKPDAVALMFNAVEVPKTAPAPNPVDLNNRIIDWLQYLVVLVAVSAIGIGGYFSFGGKVPQLRLAKKKAAAEPRKNLEIATVLQKRPS